MELNNILYEMGFYILDIEQNGTEKEKRELKYFLENRLNLLNQKIKLK